MSSPLVSPWRRLYRKLYWWPRDRRILRPLQGVRTVVAFGESLGDNLLCTRVLAGLHAAGAGPLAMATPYPELFAHLPFPVRCVPYAPALVAALQRGGPRLVIPSYGQFDAALDRHVPPPTDHLIVEMCRSAGLRGPVELKPLVSLTLAERDAGTARARDCIVVQSSNRAAQMASRNKEWPVASWQAVVDLLRPSADILQIGAATDPALTGVTDLRGRLPLREVAGVLSAARLFIGGEGFLMHLARAVDCRAVVVLGGRTAPHQTCYGENANLFTAIHCAPCWQLNTCHYDRECLRAITPAAVVEAVAAQLRLPRLTGPGQYFPLA